VDYNVLNFLDITNISGYLTITKVSKDNEEVLYSDHNTIVSGMGIGLSELFASESELDLYFMTNFQLGVSGTSTLDVITTQELAGPLSSLGEYGYSSETINYVLKSMSKYGKTFENQPFGVIPLSNITKVSDSVVRHRIVVDNQDANDLEINEIGLFMNNPFKAVFGEALLVAYKQFPAISKTDDYSLIFEWDIDFTMNS